jgi:hypothetical protein
MADPIIRLNVGGVHYNTARSTLCRVAGSMLETMFNGVIQSQKIKGRYFIDRNGQLFQHILDYLRDGEMWTPPSDLDACRSLLREAQFFCLSALVETIERVIKITTVHPPTTEQTFSVVVENDHIHFYPNTPLELTKKFISYQVKEYVLAACHELIKQAKALGYSVTSSVCIPRKILSADDRTKYVLYSIMMTFESK